MLRGEDAWKTAIPDDSSTFTRLPAGTADVNDRHFLEHFASDRTKPPSRHWCGDGSLVRVCRRVLGNDADAEDAFQATFFSWRKIRIVRLAGVDRGWLYKVAYHVATRARRSSAPPPHEQQVPPLAPTRG